MKRPLAFSLLLVLGLSILLPLTSSAGRRAVVRRAGPHHRRTVLVVHKGFPIHRRLPAVVIHTPLTLVKLAAPAVFLAPVVWTAAVVTLPPAERLAWEDRETLSEDEDWSEFTLNADSRGSALFLEIEGKAQLEFAEVVFGNGEAQVVDFGSKTYKSGVYPLLNFKDGRDVDHVRMVARAKSEEAKVILSMQK